VLWPAPAAEKLACWPYSRSSPPPQKSSPSQSPPARSADEKPQVDDGLRRRLLDAELRRRLDAGLAACAATTGRAPPFPRRVSASPSPRLYLYWREPSSAS
jgi:hypothetical protein